MRTRFLFLYSSRRHQVFPYEGWGPSLEMLGLYLSLSTANHVEDPCGLRFPRPREKFKLQLNLYISLKQNCGSSITRINLSLVHVVAIVFM